MLVYIDGGAGDGLRSANDNWVSEDIGARKVNKVLDYLRLICMLSFLICRTLKGINEIIPNVIEFFFCSSVCA